MSDTAGYGDNNVNDHDNDHLAVPSQSQSLSLSRRRLSSLYAITEEALPNLLEGEGGEGDGGASEHVSIVRCC